MSPDCSIKTFFKCTCLSQDDAEFGNASQRSPLIMFFLLLSCCIAPICLCCGKKKKSHPAHIQKRMKFPGVVKSGSDLTIEIKAPQVRY